MNSIVVIVFFLMVLCHIIDDFVLQPICLSNLKQHSWWIDNACNDGTGSFDWRKSEFYKNDYKMALFIHSLSWSIMIHLPIFFFYAVNWWWLLITVFVNCGVHYFVDDLKANKNMINLVQDQTIHFLQIIVTFFIYAL